MHLIVNYLPSLEILLEHYEHSCGILSMRKLALQVVISTGTHICMQCKPLKKIYQITCTFDQLICKYGNLRYSKGQIFLSATTQILVLILMEKRDVCGRSTTFFTTRKWNELSSLRVEPQGNCQIIVNENNWTIVGISQARQNPSFLTLDGTKVSAVSPIAFWFHFFTLSVVVPKCFIKHMCFIVLYFHGHAFFSLEVAKKCFFVLYFWKMCFIFVRFLSGWIFISSFYL